MEYGRVLIPNYEEASIVGAKNYISQPGRVIVYTMLCIMRLL